MKNKRVVITPGHIYSIDSENLSKLNDIPEEIKIVEVIKKASRQRHLGDIWLVRDTETSKEFEVPGYILCYTDQIIVRNPVDMPVINGTDLEALNNAIVLVQEAYKCEKDNPNIGPLIKKRLDILKSLKSKLEWYYNIRNV